MFSYKSDLVLSKSWLNRALVIQHYDSASDLEFNSDSEDVQSLKLAIQQIGKTTKFYLGHGGTSFRFFCFLISRLPGEWSVEAHPRLLERPQQSLQKILNQLGVESEFQKTQVIIKSKGWDLSKIIICQADESSQFVSGLLLNSWKLQQNLKFEIQKPIVSGDYLKMTVSLLQKYGLQFTQIETVNSISFVVSANQKPLFNKTKAEVDVSSAFSLAAAAVVAGEVEITNWNSASTQPDFVFLKIFNHMQIQFQQTNSSLKISQQKLWKAVSVDLNQSPDLFPVLSVLCALAEGVSNLSGASQLQFKESNRLVKTKELLDITGFRSEINPAGLVIYGKSSSQDKTKSVPFSPDQDHRMAMAAAILKLAGYNLQISNPEVVQKSYPNFWKDIQVQP